MKTLNELCDRVLEWLFVENFPCLSVFMLVGLLVAMACAFMVKVMNYA